MARGGASWKCLNFKFPPYLVKDVGYQISFISKFKIVYIIPQGIQGLRALVYNMRAQFSFSRHKWTQTRLFYRQNHQRNCEKVLKKDIWSWFWYGKLKRFPFECSNFANFWPWMKYTGLKWDIGCRKTHIFLSVISELG